MNAKRIPDDDAPVCEATTAAGSVAPDNWLRPVMGGQIELVDCTAGEPGRSQRCGHVDDKEVCR